MANHGLQLNPLLGQLAQEAGNEIRALGAEVLGHLVVSRNDPIEGATDLPGVEGRVAHNEGVEHAAERPDVRLQTLLSTTRNFAAKTEGVSLFEWLQRADLPINK